MTEPVHQIRYAWSESSLVGSRGMGPVESTLPAGLLPLWDGYLRDHVWAAAAEPGFTFIVYDGVGVLVRKAATADGRPSSAARALLSKQLTARDALGITSWPGWDDPRLDVLDWSAVEPAVEPGLADLRSRARAITPGRLAGILGQLLCSPGSSFTVIGEPDPLAVVCALGDLLGQTPAFASDEAEDSRQDLPAVVFLRKAPVSATTVARWRLDPAGPVADPQLAGFAAAVVGAYVSDGLDGIAAVRRDRPPADLAEARAWAAEGQLAPGVLADLGRLPQLSQATLGYLAAPEALGKVTAAARAAPDSQLMNALDPRIQPPIRTLLVREGLRRVSHVAVDRALLDRLADLGPLHLELVAEGLSGGFDHVVRVSRSLLTSADRRTLIERAAQGQSVAALIEWVHGHAAADPDGALAVYSALCARTGKASSEDVRTLISRQALAGAVRHIAGSPQQASAYLVTLLGALPKGALGHDAVAELAGLGDPVLHHALDTLVTDPAMREEVHRQMLLAYYRDRDLQPPVSLATDEQAPADAGRNSLFRRRHSHHRKPK